MAAPAKTRIALDRLILLSIGALAGAAAYVLLEILPDRIENARLLLLIAAATGGFFSALLAATGPLGLARAALAAALAALPAAALLYAASFRFADVEDFLETGHPPVAFVVIVAILLPYLIAAQRPGEGWRHYPALFTQAWNIVVRYAAAWIFTGLFWAVVFLSDALFGLVGLEIIEELLEIEWVPFVLTGAVLGLAMAVVVELSDYVSPFLILRLLRLLVPVVLVVTAVFLAALPLQGLSDLFGGLSAAATLLAMAIGIATLITSALDRTDAEAADAAVMRFSAQALALAMPVLAGLAIYAIWLRVADYGWTPDRLAAISAAAVILGYALLYTLAVVLRRGWMQRIRNVNIAMALVAVAVSALWLTPALNPQRISAQDQVARFARGAVEVDKLDLWFIRHDLGRAGEAAIARLAALDHPEAAALEARLARLEAAGSRRAFENRTAALDVAALTTELLAQVVVVPAGRAFPKAALDAFTPGRLRDFVEGCRQLTPAGRPGCVAVLADFVAGRPGDEGLLFYATSAERAAVRVLWPDGAAATAADPMFLAGHRSLDLEPATIDALIAGDYRIGPAEILSLRVGGAEIVVRP